MKIEEQELNTQAQESILSRSQKFWLSTIAAISFLLCITYTAFYILDSEQLASPKEIGVTSLMALSFIGFFLFLIPWEKMGLRIKKIGNIEFVEVVKEQSKEHELDISLIEQRLAELEDKVRKNDPIDGLIETAERPNLEAKLLSFLTINSPTAYSPSRIRLECRNLPEYKTVSSQEVQFIRSTLRRLVSNGKLTTTVSAKGNTLYRIIN